MAEIKVMLPAHITEDATAIHDRMLDRAPSDINTVEGDIYWDTTRPTAESIAEMVHMKLIPLLYQGFSQTAEEGFLDLHGDEFGAFRKDPNYSSGFVTISGTPGTIIQAGTIVSTEVVENEEPITFQTTLNGVIGSDGTANIPITATIPGNGSNVAAGAITMTEIRQLGIRSVTNASPTMNGTNIETDDAFRKRVLIAKREKAESGNKVDYMRWALEVPGVGYVYVKPIWNGPGTVKVTILDEDYLPANPLLLTAVQNYIAPNKSNHGDGQAPVGAVVTVTTPEVKLINISARITISEGVNQDAVKRELEDRIKNYLATLEVWDVLIYKAVEGILGSLILEEKGVTDYRDLLINNNTINVELIEELAQLGTVTII